MFKGVHHVGIGVSDMERSIEFYGDCLGFKEVVFDYSGSLPGMSGITGTLETIARVVMLGSEHKSPFGLGMLKLVQLLPPYVPGPIPDGTCWGEIGIAEACISVQNLDGVYEQLVGEKGCRCIMPPQWGPLPPHGVDTGLWYTVDPDGGKLELLEWRGVFSGWERKARVDGVNHVAFGVADMDRSLNYYRKLGFGEILYEWSGVFEAMNPWFPKPVHQNMILLANHYGAGVEIVQHVPQSKDLRGSWGHLGPMDFAVQVTNLEQACVYLDKSGIRLSSDPQTVELPSGSWKYVFIDEPDGNYVSLIEPRFW
jgi:catechol 2,3-dioxygenase-like lactoylglutathione lyase family enzyme